MVKRILIILLMLIIAGGGAFVINKQWQTRLAHQAEQQEIQRQMVPLQQEKRALMDQMVQLEKQLNGKMSEPATVQILFSQLDERLYLEVFPAMLQYGLKGIMALSGDQYPGAPGCITARQFDEMIRDGWTYCLQWDGSMALWDAFTAAQWMMPENAIEMPDTIYLNPGVYTKKLDTDLVSQGVRMVIHHGEDGLPVDITDTQGSLWHLGSALWKNETARQILKTNLDNRGNLVFDVKFDWEGQAYDSLGIRDLLYAISTGVTEEVVQVTDFSEVKKLYTYTEDNYRWLRKEDLSSQMSEIQDRIDELDAQLEAISRGQRPQTEKTENTEPDLLSSLDNERMRLQRQIERYENEHPYQMAGRATFELLFLTPELSLYNEIFPQIMMRQAKASIAVSPYTLPGREGCLSWEQWGDLLDHGWEACVSWANDADTLNQTTDIVKKAFEEQGLAVPERLFISQGGYDPAIETKAKDLGFSVVIFHGETGSPLADYPTDGIWTTGSLLWSPQSQVSAFDPIVEERKNLVISIPLQQSVHPYMETGLFELLEGTKDYVTEGRLLYTSFTEARATQEESALARQQINREREDYLSELNKQLSAVEEQIIQAREKTEASQ